ncbi:uncharacterized protein RAG0_15757 [Rhynchosporium agropyri]|uniref:Uncharacterized protein n=1 Tax=Rhynchosporium agropyri TaxID=914238 RepID=A0A1E1LMF0_9HELO|nr:uncharacterized protein RAG0_15757 [Rhynchosporium agropyri]
MHGRLERLWPERIAHSETPRPRFLMPLYTEKQPGSYTKLATS